MTIRIQWNHDGLYRLRSSPGARADLEARGRRVLAEAGESKGYVMSSQQGARRPSGRWRVTVMAAGPWARRDNAKHNTLIHALGAAK